jgi:signal transduction histidine kinase
MEEKNRYPDNLLNKVNLKFKNEEIENLYNKTFDINLKLICLSIFCIFCIFMKFLFLNFINQKRNTLLLTYLTTNGIFFIITLLFFIYYFYLEKFGFVKSKLKCDKFLRNDNLKIIVKKILMIIILNNICFQFDILEFFLTTESFSLSFFWSYIQSFLFFYFFNFISHDFILNAIGFFLGNFSNIFNPKINHSSLNMVLFFVLKLLLYIVYLFISYNLIKKQKYKFFINNEIKKEIVSLKNVLYNIDIGRIDFNKELEIKFNKKFFDILTNVHELILYDKERNENIIDILNSLKLFNKKIDNIDPNEIHTNINVNINLSKNIHDNNNEKDKDDKDNNKDNDKDNENDKDNKKIVYLNDYNLENKYKLGSSYLTLDDKMSDNKNPNYLKNLNNIFFLFLFFEKKSIKLNPNIHKEIKTFINDNFNFDFESDEFIIEIINEYFIQEIIEEEKNELMINKEENKSLKINYINDRSNQNLIEDMIGENDINVNINNNKNSNHEENKLPLNKLNENIIKYILSNIINFEEKFFNKINIENSYKNFIQKFKFKTKSQETKFIKGLNKSISNFANNNNTIMSKNSVLNLENKKEIKFIKKNFNFDNALITYFQNRKSLFSDLLKKIKEFHIFQKEFLPFFSYRKKTKDKINKIDINIQVSIFFDNNSEKINLLFNDISYPIKASNFKGQNKIKKKILKKISHEFRNPLINILQILKNIKQIGLSLFNDVIHLSEREIYNINNNISSNNTINTINTNKNNTSNKNKKDSSNNKKMGNTTNNKSRINKNYEKRDINNIEEKINIEKDEKKENLINNESFNSKKKSYNSLIIEKSGSNTTRKLNEGEVNKQSSQFNSYNLSEFKHSNISTNDKLNKQKEILTHLKKIKYICYFLNHLIIDLDYCSLIDLHKSGNNLLQLGNSSSNINEENNIISNNNINDNEENDNNNKIDIINLIEKISKIFKNKIDLANKMIEINLQFEENVPIFVYSSEEKISQIIFNLLSNSLKFTKTGFIDIKVCYIKHLSNIEIIVQDSGCGIKEEKINLIFTPFNKTSNDENNIYGLGMGLFITKNLLKKLNGGIVVESIVNRFTIVKIHFKAYDNPFRQKKDFEIINGNEDELVSENSNIRKKNKKTSLKKNSKNKTVIGLNNNNYNNIINISSKNLNSIIDEESNSISIIKKEKIIKKNTSFRDMKIQKKEKLKNFEKNYSFRDSDNLNSLKRTSTMNEIPNKSNIQQENSKLLKNELALSIDTLNILKRSQTSSKLLLPDDKKIYISNSQRNFSYSDNNCQMVELTQYYNKNTNITNLKRRNTLNNYDNDKNFYRSNTLNNFKLEIGKNKLKGQIKSSSPFRQNKEKKKIIYDDPLFSSKEEEIKYFTNSNESEEDYENKSENDKYKDIIKKNQISKENQEILNDKNLKFNSFIFLDNEDISIMSKKNSKKNSKNKMDYSYSQFKDDEIDKLSNDKFSSFLKKDGLKNDENELVYIDDDLSSFAEGKEEEQEIFNQNNNIFEKNISSDEISNDNEIISFKDESKEINPQSLDKIIIENNIDISKPINNNNFDNLNKIDNLDNSKDINKVNNKESIFEVSRKSKGNDSFYKNSCNNSPNNEYREKTVINYERFLDNRFIDVRVLVVDDEKLIRQSNINLIKKHFIDMDVNLLICECEDGFDCLDNIYRFKKKGIEFNYIITDQTMNYICGTVLSDIINLLITNGVIKDINMYMLTSYSTKIIKNNSNFIEIFCKPLKKRHLETMFIHLDEDLEDLEEDENYVDEEDEEQGQDLD